jgi:hypothetical protein
MCDSRSADRGSGMVVPVDPGDDGAVTNADVTRELIGLREAVAFGSAPPDRVVSEFERLTYLLTGVDQDGDRQLRAFVNELERILFTRLPENQVPEMVRVLANAQVAFSSAS